MNEALRAALHMLSQRGWDRVGDPDAMPWEFHHNSTYETVQVMPDEVLLWAAQLEPRAAPPPSDADDWYVINRLMIVGWCEVRSRSGRRSGYEQRITPRFLMFSSLGDATEAARLLNMRDSLLRQERMSLDPGAEPSAPAYAEPSAESL